MAARKASKKKLNLASFGNSFFYISLLSLFILGLANIYGHMIKEPRVIVLDTTEADIAFWENIQRNNPTYRDAYIVLSQIKSKEGDVLGAKTMIEEALEVDPFTITQNSL